MPPLSERGFRDREHTLAAMAQLLTNTGLLERGLHVVTLSETV